MKTAIGTGNAPEQTHSATKEKPGLVVRQSAGPVRGRDCTGERGNGRSFLAHLGQVAVGGTPVKYVAGTAG